MVSDSIKFYMDEHIPKAVTEGLRRRGVNVLSAQEAGMLGANDYDLLSLANKEGRVIFTKDADFLRLHKAGISHRGIIYSSKQSLVGYTVRVLMMIYDLVTLEEMVGRVEFI